MGATFGFIGCGNFAQALVAGAVKSKAVSGKRVFISTRSFSRTKKIAKTLRVQAVKDNVSLVKKCQVVFIATKPQDIKPVLEEISQWVTEGKTVVSLAAGVPSRVLTKYFSSKVGLMRVMGNIPAQVQRGVFGSFVARKSRHEKDVEKFLSKIGVVIKVSKENQIDAITAAAGSGPGFIYLYMEAYQQWLQGKGFTVSQARTITVDTFAGATRLLRKSGQKISSTREKVTSKRGTTEAGIKSLRKSGVVSKLKASLSAAFRRSQEISKSLR